jgi:hypothetical protein
MHVIFILLHIVAAIAAAFFVIGIISVIKGFVFKNEKNIKHGMYITAIAVFCLASFHMAARFHRDKMNQQNCRNIELKGDGKCIEKCIIMSDGVSGTDSMDAPCCKMKMHEKMMMMHHGEGEASKCDTSMCKKKCQHAK